MFLRLKKVAFGELGDVPAELEVTVQDITLDCEYEGREMGWSFQFRS